jgi:hypothetical protein
MRHSVSGLLILLMIIVTIVNGFDLIGDGELPLWVAGIAA